MSIPMEKSAPSSDPASTSNRFLTSEIKGAALGFRVPRTEYPQVARSDVQRGRGVRSRNWRGDLDRSWGWGWRWTWSWDWSNGRSRVQRWSRGRNRGRCLIGHRGRCRSRPRS
ncbi:hypothetical protein AAFF_G00364330 [Aldrovandia affinis]|uniref:Uncharacterized protein n=1 Tax=Aldrovandia affinis TaxID=143900 RepID=A0AAD7WMR1_9TELE|nr:hypothetical protein AAFF_G00364330 [Aldrovandia affinis]